MRRHRFSSEEKPAKMAQTFFLLDCHTGQPVCFSITLLCVDMYFWAAKMPACNGTKSYGGAAWIS